MDTIEAKVEVRATSTSVSEDMQHYILSLLCRLTPDHYKLIEELIRKLIILQNLQNPNAANLEAKSLTEYVPLWATYLLNQRKASETIRNYRYYVEHLLAQFPRPTPTDIQTFIALEQGTGAGVSAQNNRISAIKSFFTYLDDIGVLVSNPTARLKRPHSPCKRRELPPVEDLARLMSSDLLSVRDAALLLLWAGCGLRINESLTLRPQDVSFTPPEVYVTGKGSKPRTQPMPPEAADAVFLQMVDIPPTSKWLFPGRPPTKHISSKAVQKHLQYLCQQLGIKEFTPHILRHYYASALRQDGVDLLSVSRLLGHAGPDVTAKVYIHDLYGDDNRKTLSQHNPLKFILGKKSERRSD